MGAKYHCPQCGKETAPVRHSVRRIFCSRECSNRSRKRPVLDRINELIRVVSDDCHLCHLWTGYTGSGYPLIFADGKKRLVGRILWEHHRGPIPDGLVVRHKCDNTLCLRIGHLLLGTQKDNMQDAVRRGRIASGDRNGMKKKARARRNGMA